LLQLTIFIENIDLQIPQRKNTDALCHTKMNYQSKKIGNVANVNNIGTSNMTDGVHTTSKESNLYFLYPANLKKFLKTIFAKI
jgi:hypothetical protein